LEDNKNIEKEFNEYHEKEFNDYMEYLESLYDKTKEEEKASKLELLYQDVDKETFEDIVDSINKEEDEEYLNINNWNKKTWYYI